MGGHKCHLYTREAEAEGWLQGQSQPVLMPRLSSGEKTRVEAGDKEWWCLPKPQEGDLADGPICDQAAGGGQKEVTAGRGFLPESGVPWGEGRPLSSRDPGTWQ